MAVILSQKEALTIKNLIENRYRSVRRKYGQKFPKQVINSMQKVEVLKDKINGQLRIF